MKMFAVLGTLGSGKTTLISQLFGAGRELPGKTLFVVNDVGQVNIDAERLRSVGEIAALTAGCIGCSDIEAFKTVIREARENGVETLVVEPTGIADGREIAAAARTTDIQMTCITLIDIRHFGRNQALGVMETQLQVANVVGLTWADGVDSPEGASEEILDFIGTYAPKRTILLIDESVTLQAISSLSNTQLTTQYSPHLYLGRRLFRNYSESTIPNHGVFAESGSISEETTREDWVTFIAGLGDNLIRSKGVIAGRRFDFTQGTLVWGEPDDSPAHATLITKQRLGLLSGKTISGEKKSLMRGYKSTPEETAAAITWQLAEYPRNRNRAGEIRVDCEADIVRQLCERPGVDRALRSKVIQQYVTWRIHSLQLLHKGDYSQHPDYHYWQRRLGGVLCWHAWHCKAELGEECIESIIKLNAVRIELEGLLGLPGLSFLEEKAEERPDLVEATLLFADSVGQLDQTLASEAVQHCVQLSRGNDEWHNRWLELVRQFGL
jgi:G3E family GTPase